MKRFKAYIDGRAGTTGLELERRLLAHPDIELLTISEAQRKDEKARKALFNEADVAFLCLPDEAARAALSLVENPNTVLIDASTAHRTAPGWAYGFAELSPSHRAAIRDGKRIANPGCHATGFIALVYPLVAEGLLRTDANLSCFSLTGYSGGGKKMIAEYEDAGRPAVLDSPGQYALDQRHKHLPEMQAVCGLDAPPLFSPIVGDFPRGMAVSVPLFGAQMEKRLSLPELIRFYEEWYGDQPLISVSGAPEGSLYASALANTDELALYVLGNDERIVLVSLLDNLGKGAAGAAVQNMNIALGLPQDRAMKGRSNG